MSIQWYIGIYYIVYEFGFIRCNVDWKSVYHEIYGGNKVHNVQMEYNIVSVIFGSLKCIDTIVYCSTEEKSQHIFIRHYSSLFT